jgi:uncharacterized protein (TIGR03435 family)
MAAEPAFEVVSVKRAVAPTELQLMRSSIFDAFDPPPLKGSRIRMLCRSFTSLVSEAYGVRADQVTGPSWISREYFDIEATAPRGTTRSQAPEMLRALLEERFGLTVHRERRMRSLYVLGIKPDGPHLTRYDSATATTLPKPAEREASARAMLSGGTTHSLWRNITLKGLARSLSHLLNWPMEDATALDGNYDIDLEYTLLGMEDRANNAVSVVIPSLVRAVEKLGLTLEWRKTFVEMVIVDRAARVPEPN